MPDNRQYVTGNYLALPYLVPVFDEFFPEPFLLPLSLLFFGLCTCGFVKVLEFFISIRKEKAKMKHQLCNTTKP